MLEIGPGATPHPQATVLLEKRYESEEEYVRQCGGLRASGKDSRTVFFDGGRLPFADGEFDYVICSHVLEHVPDVEAFCSELFRVARGGYLEYPLIYYEFVYNIPEHVNVLKRTSKGLVYLPKTDLALGAFSEIQRFWFETLNAGYVDTVGDLVPNLMEGFEWFVPLAVTRADSIRALLHNEFTIPQKTSPRTSGLRRFLLPLSWARNRLNRLSGS